MEAPEPISVSELTRRIRALLEDSIGDVLVTGEISNFRTPSSGHWYFTLKDEGATLNAVMFRSEATRVGFLVADGQAIIVRGRITVYETRGQYQIVVSQLWPHGMGTLQQQFDALQRKLASEGLFHEERKRPLPPYPETVGIVTALQGAVLQDFTRILKRRAPWLRILVCGVRVQGLGAAEEVAQAIQRFNHEGEVEVIVLARGGGSLEDLWAFNEEVVARALAASKIPTVSAIGHETDFTIADFVADLRAPTPSAAAELLSQNWMEGRGLLQQWLVRLQRGTKRELECRHERWERLRQSYVFREPARVVQQFQQLVDDLADTLADRLRSGLKQNRHDWEKIILRWKTVHPHQILILARERLSQWERRLRALGPQNTLSRGYALILDEKGQIIRQADTNLVNQSVEIRLSHGALTARVLKAKTS